MFLHRSFNQIAKLLILAFILSAVLVPVLPALQLIPTVEADHCGGAQFGHPGGTDFPCDYGGATTIVDDGSTTGVTNTSGSATGGATDGVVPTFRDASDGDGGIMTNFLEWVGTNVGALLMSITGWFVWLGGELFDWTVNELVLRFGYYASNVFGGPIDTTWTVIRDLCNIIFIFGFVYIGIWTILDPSSTNTKKLLSRLIIAAILINFSLFFVKVVIDVANVFAVETYQLMNVNSVTPSGTTVQGGIALSFLTHMGLVTLYETDGTVFYRTNHPEGSFMFLLGASAFQLVAAFVFIAAAIMLLIRFALLLIYMVFSPLLFATMVFPQTAGIGRRLWSNILSNAFFAPIFLLLVYVSFSIITSGVAALPAGGTDSLASALKNESDFEIVMWFFLIIMFLVISLVAAKNIGAAGATTAVNVMNNARKSTQRTLTRTGGAMTAGVAARGGRRLIGGSALALRDSERVQRNMKKGGVAGAFARTTALGADKVGGMSFDARQVAGVGKSLNLGEGKKGGRKKDIENEEKRQKKIAGLINTDDAGAKAVEADYQTRDTSLKNVEQSLNRDIVTAKNHLRQSTQPKLQELSAALAEQSRLLNDPQSSERALDLAKNRVEAINLELKTINDQYNRSIAALESTKKQTSEQRKTTSEQGKVEAKATKFAGREQYASTIENRRLWKGNTLSAASTNQKYATSIRKEWNKGDNDKLIDAIKSSAASNS